MGQRGPPRKPQDLKNLQNTWRADRDSCSSPPAAVARPSTELPPDAPACPPDLNPDERKIWDETIPQLLRMGVLEMTASSVIKVYCAMRARALVLDAIAAKTPIVETPAGPKAHPAAVEARLTWKVVEKLASDLGLTYAARARAGAPTTPKGEAARERLKQAEAFLFGGARLLILPGGKKEGGT